MATTSDTILEEAADHVRPSQFLDYRVYLDGLFSYLSQKVARYSYKQFAEDLGFGRTTVMHQIARGYRPLSVKAAERICKAIKLAGLEKKFLVTLVEYSNARSSRQRETLFERLLAMKSETLPTEFDKDCLEYFSEWFHPVIRELVGMPGFKAEPEWIAARLVPRVRPEQAKASLELLLRLGFVARDEQGNYAQTQTRVTTGHRVQGMGLVRFHQCMIEHGREALTRIPSQRRDISAITVSVNDATAQKLRAMIHAFQLQLLDEAEKSGSGDQVYQVNIQLFPFTD